MCRQTDQAHNHMGRQARARRKAQKGGGSKTSTPAKVPSNVAESPRPSDLARKVAKKSLPSSSASAKSRVRYVPNSRLIHGFRILELFNDASWSNFPRIMYVKRHFSNDAENADRTVFVTGLPVDVPVRELEKTLERSFARAFGPVQHARITMLKDTDGHTNVRCGHVVFEEEDAVEAALSEAEFGVRDVPGETGSIPAEERHGEEKSVRLGGLEKFLLEAKALRPPVKMLREAVEEGMAAVEEEEAAARAEKERLKNVVDADGFTLVSGKRKISHAAAQVRCSCNRPHGVTFQRACWPWLPDRGSQDDSVTIATGNLLYSVSLLCCLHVVGGRKACTQRPKEA